jgi:Family of unknown function (DUF6786)
MLSKLRQHDAQLIELTAGDGAVLVSPGLQGRIFCRIGDELIHKLDGELMENPSPDEFNNLGGNSLWPAPEGGKFAFNYPPDSDEWFVPEGIDSTNPSVTLHEPGRVVVGKEITLPNRKGTQVRVLYKRDVAPLDLSPETDGFDITSVGYVSEDAFIPLKPYTRTKVLIAPWSLEQFPGGEGVIAFAKAGTPREAINDDFYGDPAPRLAYGADHFTFKLGGKDRLQIGITVKSKPTLLGALDTNRSLLMLRCTKEQGGTYFNIADNDQPDGPYSAADLYSIFNGGDLGFWELETIGALQEKDGLLAASALVSETRILKGPVPELLRYLKLQQGLTLLDFSE